METEKYERHIRNLRAYLTGGVLSCDDELKSAEEKILRITLSPIPDQQRIYSLVDHHKQISAVRKYITDLIKNFPELKNENIL